MVSRLQFSSLWQQKPSQETSTHSPNSLAGEGGGGSSSPSRLVSPAPHKTIGKQNFGDNYKASSLQVWLTWVQGAQECHQTPGEQGDTRRMGFEEIPVASPPQPSWGWILLDTGQEHWTDPTCSSPAPTASQGCCSMHTLLLKYPICSSGKGQSKEWMLKRKRGGRMREQTNHISSNQSRPRK